MGVGTTFTAAMATFGGSTSMRRTGYAHIVYSVMTAIAAFALLPLYTGLVERYVINGGHTNAQLTLVAFHTGFNTLAAAVMLAFTRPFARLIERLVPERGPPLVGKLDPLLLKEPAAAVDAAVASIGAYPARLFLSSRMPCDRKTNPGRRRPIPKQSKMHGAWYSVSSAMHIQAWRSL